MKRKNAPVAPQVPLELWRELYQAATEFQLLAPWEWMDSNHVLGINNEQGMRLVTVMGNMGEVFGLASYRGRAGINFLLRLLREEFEPENPDIVFYQDALLVDFVPRRELRKEDRAILQRIDFKPAASRPTRVPQFSSHRPGYMAWFIEEAEARQALDDLGKTLRFAQLLRTKSDFFDSRQPEEFPFFPATVSEPLSLEQFEWHKVLPVPPPPDPPVAPELLELAKLLQVPQSPGSTWELAAFYSPLAIGEGPRPYWPKMGLGVETEAGLILGFHTGTPQETMAETAALGLAQCIQAAGLRPSIIRVDSLNVFHALGPIAESLGSKLVHVKSLPAANEARRSLEAMSMG